MALMYDEFGRALERLERAKIVSSIGKLSGAVGTNAHLPPRVEKYVCRKLGVKPAPMATQVIQRDNHAEFLNAIAVVGASMERWAVEFRHLQRTEVLRLRSLLQRGKKEAARCRTNATPSLGSVSRGYPVLRGNALAAMENVALWHERDISHSSVERVIFPDSCALLNYMFALLQKMMEGLNVYPKNMKKNLGISLGMWNSQTVLLALIVKV